MELNLDKIFEELKKMLPENMSEEMKNTIVTGYRFMLAIN